MAEACVSCVLSCLSVCEFVIRSTILCRKKESQDVDDKMPFTFFHVQYHHFYYYYYYYYYFRWCFCAIYKIYVHTHTHTSSCRCVRAHDRWISTPKRNNETRNKNRQNLKFLYSFLKFGEQSACVANGQKIAYDSSMDILSFTRLKECVFVFLCMNWMEFE